ncbi:MAG TPA: formylglycine-generating enzyme family protein [Pirellulales bacterium]|nr:formylglycine-generating enzyme family protein [Pirellulales bacterium]
MKLALIPPGEFMMGAAEDEDGADDDEKPRHLVRISRGFYLGIHEVTQDEYEKVKGTPDFPRGGDLPVTGVAAVDAEEFCRLLTDREHSAARLPMEAIYRLPTEAEWEYAARAGTATKWYSGDNDKQLDGYAWYSQNSGDKTHPVGEKLQNAWGLFDMHGNVWEWCSDWYGPYGDAAVVADPAGPKEGERRVLRGGAFSDNASIVRSADRSYSASTSRDTNFGFRVVRTYP